jgi:GDPmannose 4,6-dehydratase
MAVNAMGAINVIEAAKDLGAKFYQASTSELFGITKPPQNEKSKFHPRSPYGVAKLAAYYTTVNYREAVKAYNGILFNHESPRRGKDFVTQKIAEGVARIYLGQQDFITLGNLDARRDWGHAKDYVEGMWLMLQHEPDDYVLATGETHSIRDLLSEAFKVINEDWKRYVQTSDKLLRPAEVPDLCGDPSKAESIGWARKYTFSALVREMVEDAIHRMGGSLP